MIAVDCMTIIRATKIIPDPAFRELPATRAEIARVFGIHADDLPTGALGRVDKEGDKATPRCVANRTIKRDFWATLMPGFIRQGCFLIQPCAEPFATQGSRTELRLFPVR